MKFGPVPVTEAKGAILAHTLHLKSQTVQKGTVLGAADIARLVMDGVRTVTVAQPDPLLDIGENEAATQLAKAIVPDPDEAHVRIERADRGRVHIRATSCGVLGLDVAAIMQMNAIDPAITLATLPPFKRVDVGSLVATVKMITFAVPRVSLGQAQRIARDTLHVRPVIARDATLIQTTVPGTENTSKGEASIRARLERLGMAMRESVTVAHDVDALAAAVAMAEGEVILILTGAATSDLRDVAPSAVREAGGEITRFGMPVDPGNLLFTGSLGAAPIIGLPGCARSPALNGADWVLERLVCGVPITDEDIAGMGVGGLLKDTTSRGHPRG